jgi:signal transduction histidine kinase
MIRTILRAPFTARAWREFGYVIATLPLAALAFALGFLPFVLGLALIVLVIGLLLVAVALWSARGFGAAFRWLARLMLGMSVTAPEPDQRAPGFFGWLSASLRSGTGWRAIVYCVLRFPFAVVTCYLGIGVWLYGVVGFAYPLMRYANTIEIGRARFDSLPSALMISAAGVVVIFIAPWVVHGLVLIDQFAIRHLLSGGDGLQQRVRELETSRAIAVDDASATLRRIERDLHDGAQAKLVALAMDLTMVRDQLRPDEPDLVSVRQLVDAAHGHAKEAIGELRDLARGIHPPVLERGLVEALQTLAARSPVPVRFSADLRQRPDAAIETIAYFCAAELLTNVARHSRARLATLELSDVDDSLVLRVSDDGHGGARSDARRADGGTGLPGLADRVRTVDGSLTVQSPAGGPTVVTVTLPNRV